MPDRLRDYLELYNKTDVLLLADVFENVRDVSMKQYKLDPAWYYTVPGLSWDVALKLTDVKLEFLSDPDMLLMVKQGISSILTPYAIANNKYMGEAYDPNRSSKCIIYLDNLYGWAMSQPLPTHGFEWMSNDVLNNWRNMSDGEGCILEVDLKYDQERHNFHND